MTILEDVLKSQSSKQLTEDEHILRSSKPINPNENIFIDTYPLKHPNTNIIDRDLLPKYNKELSIPSLKTIDFHINENFYKHSSASLDHRVWSVTPDHSEDSLDNIRVLNSLNKS